MKFAEQFWEDLGGVAYEVGRADEASVGFLDDGSAVVTVEYVVTEERWDALEAEWQARAGSDRRFVTASNGVQESTRRSLAKIMAGE